MKIKIIKTKVEGESEIKIINFDQSDYLQIGMCFHVFSLEICIEATYFYVYHDYYLFPLPSGLFEIIDGSIPHQWSIRKEDESIYLCPELFNEPYFYDRLSDHEEDLNRRFGQLAIEMYPDFKFED